MFQDLLTAFIPIFFAIDAPGILPTFLSLTSEQSIMQRKKLVNKATLTAFMISLFFIFCGKALFGFLHISISDFKIAGGILLLVLSIYDLIFDTGQRRSSTGNDTLAIVPIGTPLIIGPAVLTTMLLMVDSVGYTITVGSIILNLIIVWLTFYFSDKVIKVITKSGAIAIGKVFQLFLAAIAVMLIRSGITELIN